MKSLTRIDQSLKQTKDEIAFNLENIQVFLKRLETAPSEQVLVDSEALVSKSYFYLKSMSLSASSITNIEMKYMIVRGLFLIAKKLHKVSSRKFSAFKDCCYSIYLRFNVIDKIQMEIVYIRTDLVKLNLEKSQNGQIIRGD